MEKVDRLLIDGDILCYRCGFACERKEHVAYIDGKEVDRAKGKEGKDSLLSLYPEARIESKVVVEPVNHALQSIKTTVESIQEKAMVEDYQMFLSGSGDTFRNQIATIKPYKGNRENARQPVHKKEITQYLIKHYKAKVTDGIEADDALGLSQDPGTCIVSIDKDLLMIPGWHFNWIKDEFTFVDEYDAAIRFYTQLLTGDSVDNIPGIHGIGPKKAENIIKKACKTLREEDPHLYRVEKVLWETVLDTYKKLTNYTQEQVEEIGHLLWIQRADRRIWQPPKLK